MIISDILKKSENELNFVEAVSLVGGQHLKEHLIQARKFFHNRLKKLNKNDFEGQGTCYYYLLKIDLTRSLTTETEGQKKLFNNMTLAFEKQEIQIIKNYKKDKSLLNKMQSIAFYKLMEGYYSSIEYLFDQHDAIEAVEKSYEIKMTFRKYRFWLEKQYSKWAEYFLLNITCRYGNSFGRWGLTGVFFIIIFGLLYWVSDLNHSMVIDHGGQFYNYFYYSVVTFTTLGFGDIIPISGLQKFFTGIEVFLGYVQLGLFLTLIQKKL